MEDYKWWNFKISLELIKVIKRISEIEQSLKSKLINILESINFFGITAYRFHGKMSCKSKVVFKYKISIETIASMAVYFIWIE